jgi:hypothetical protein
MIATDHEGKTPGSALLEIFRVYDAKKNLGGCTEYADNYRDLFFVSPKCGKGLG